MHDSGLRPTALHSAGKFLPTSLLGPLRLVLWASRAEGTRRMLRWSSTSPSCCTASAPTLSEPRPVIMPLCNADVEKKRGKSGSDPNAAAWPAASPDVALAAVPPRSNASHATTHRRRRRWGGSVVGWADVATRCRAEGAGYRRSPCGPLTVEGV